MDELTVEEIKKEIVKCGKNPSYFLKNYAKISHPDRGMIPFKTYDFQDDLLNKFRDHRFNIIVKARQLGISTICAGYIAWLLLFYREKNVLVMATKYSTASNMVKKVKYIVANVPEWLKIATVKIDNKHSFELTNGSQIKAVATSEDAGRSEAVSLLVVDEAAHIDNMDSIWTALYPTISTGGRCVALSSPNGIGNWFHKTYEDSQNGQNLFIPTNLPWNVHPDHNQEWFDNETKNLAKREIAQEYLCSFNASGETVIDPDDLQRIRENVCEPKQKAWTDRNYHVWKPYNHQGKYILCADVARGDGNDYSVFHVINASTMEQVAEYQGKIEPDQFVSLLETVGKEYGNALLVVENNNIGFTVAQKLASNGYRNLYYSSKTNHDYLEPNMAYGNSNAVAGFTTSVKTRPLIIAKLDELIRNSAIDCSLFKNINYFDRDIFKLDEIDINTSQGKKIKYKLGDDKKLEPKCLIGNLDDIKENSNGFREETYKHLGINLRNKIKYYVLELIHKNKRFLSYNEIKNRFINVDNKILMYAINNSIYPNIIIDNISLIPHQDGIHIIDIIEDNPLKITLEKEEEEEEEKDNNIIINEDFYPQTNFYFINVSKIDYLNNTEYLNSTYETIQSIPDYNGRIWEYFQGWSCEDFLKDLEKYPLGKKRTLRDYERFAGVNFKNLKLIEYDPSVLKELRTLQSELLVLYFH